MLMDTLSKLSAPIIGFLVTVVFGFWLSKLGKPYNGILFNVHKLIALGTVIVTGTQIYGTFKTLDAQTLLILLTIVMGLCVVALFASGAFLSIGNLNYAVVLTVHRVALVLGSVAIVMLIYLLYRSLL